MFVFFSTMHIGRSYKLVKVERVFAASASSAMDRMVREVREADALDDTESVYGASPGQIMLQPGSIRFFVEDGILKMQEGAGTPGILTSPGVNVTDFIVEKITTPNSEALKMEMELEVRVGKTVRSKRFFSTAVLKGSY